MNTALSQFRLAASGAVASAAMLVSAPVAAQAVSDVLTVTFDGVTQTRTILEAPGEDVTSDLSFTFEAAASGDFVPGRDNSDAFLLEGRATEGKGVQSDRISFRVDAAGGRTVHFTMGSDEDPGRNNLVAGIPETGALQNITSTLFFGAVQIDSTGLYSVKGHTIRVLAQSDTDSGVSPVPEPGNYALLAMGLAGIGWVARRRGRGNS